MEWRRWKNESGAEEVRNDIEKYMEKLRSNLIRAEGMIGELVEYCEEVRKLMKEVVDDL